MILRKYFQKRKHEMFPHIKDWTDPMNNIRLNNNVRDMKWDDWFWFHPSAFSLIHFGYPVISILFFGIITYFLFSIPVIWVFSLMGMGYFAYDLIKKIKTKDHYNLMTMHDIYLREDTYFEMPEYQNIEKNAEKD